MFLGGRYRKLARDVPQSEWILDGKRKGRSSVDEIISEKVQAAFGTRVTNFHAAGREDADVRMLGKGRPFILELADATNLPVTQQQMQQLQAQINEPSGLNSCQDVEVEALQLASKGLYQEIKDGAEDKHKTYSCVVWSSKPHTAAQLHQRLDQRAPVELAQDTPIRVVHRRAQSTRTKHILTMQTHWLNSHWFTLELGASAGTYIKEFVHGDLGRTQPSVAELLGDGTKVDIVQLDVLDVHMQKADALMQ